MWSCVQRARRKTSTASPVAQGVWLGEEWGLEDRSASPAMPSARNRPNHLATVLAVETACGLSLRHGLIHDGANHGLSTFRRKMGILVNVHSVLRRITTLADISFDRTEWTTLKIHI